MDFSVIIPVYHEEAEINEALRHLRSLSRSHRAEIIVVDGDPAGSTLKVMEEHPSVTRLTGPKGRAAQMNAGAGRAGNEILIFLHADTRLPAGAYELIEEVFQKKEIVGGAFHLEIDSDRPYLKLVAWMANRRTRLNRVPYGDQAIFLDRGYFQTIGGYAAMPLMEEVELMRRIKKRGDSIALLDAAVTTSARRWEEEGVCYVTFRNWTLAILYTLGVPPEFLVRFYGFGNPRRKRTRE